MEHHRDDISVIKQHASQLPTKSFVWLLLSQPTNEELSPIAEWLELNEFAVSDCLQSHRRAKRTIDSDVGVIVTKTIWYVSETRSVETGDVTCVVTENVILTAQHGPKNPMIEAQKALTHRSSLLRHGPWSVVYAIVGQIVQSYVTAADQVADDISQVELRVFSDERVNAVAEIYTLQREVLEFRDGVQPLVAIADEMLSKDNTVNTHSERYFREIAHHVRRVATSIDASHSLLNSILESNLGQISIWQNEDMRKMSAWAAIIAAPTVITGIYGMNFSHMPELHWLVSYPLALVVILVACVLLYRGFRRNGWL